MSHAQLATAIMVAPFLTVAIIGLVAEVMRICADEKAR